MNDKNPKDVTFQITVGQLTISSPLSGGDIRVTVRVGDMSKITCSGDLSEDGLMVTWDHPFLFSALPSTNVGISICILPEELSTEWDKQPLGTQMATDVAHLLESAQFGNAWQCNVPGLTIDPATLSMICRVSDVLTASNVDKCISALTRDHKKLSKFAKQFKNVACVSTSVEVDLARLDLCPLGHAGHIGILDDLATVFSLCYTQGGNISDLNRNIELRQIMLDLCPLGHPEHAQALGGLARSLRRYCRIQKNKTDLNRLIEIQQRWLDLCPLGHPDHADALGELAMSFKQCYTIYGNMTDLDKAIEMQEKKLDLCIANHSRLHTALNNLANSISARYRKLGQVTDLNKAIDLKEKCLELHPPGHPFRGLILHNLALSLHDHYQKTRNQSDLIKITKLFKEALNTYPVHHRYYACNAGQLAKTILLHSKSSQKCQSSGQSIPSSDEAFEIYRLLKHCVPAVSLDLLKALQHWVKDAEDYSHSSVLEAYQISLSTLDHFTSFNSSLGTRHEAMQARMADLANDAFSCAIRHGDFQMAVEFLEQGRGILWNQLARFDISIVTLESLGNKGHELGEKFMQLSTTLKEHAQGSGNSTDSYWRVQEEWQSVVEKIRHLDGFSRFLIPPCFSDLQQAAEHGPVIIVNASEYTCDALIVLHTRSPVHVSLPCSFADADLLCSQLSELTRDPHAYGDHRESWMKETLRELWSSVVEPIASALQNDIQLPPGSRIWWCPTSKFTTLPLHAAGPHRKAQKNFFDIYVSSYAPSLSALLRARDRIHSQREAHDASGKGNLISFAAVGQGRPSVDTKLGELPEVEHEIRRIRNETGMLRDVEFDIVTGGAATIEGAVQAFREHRWVHVACHGAQHAEKPFDSWFAMGDGKLTLMRIIQERYTNSEFAFLSACHTAVGDASTPDEVLHLAAGMQFAGFNGVIGTLWRVDDAVAHQVVTRFYKEMFRRPDIGFEHAAAALNTAVVETANEVSLEKRIVFVHIGI